MSLIILARVNSKTEFGHVVQSGGCVISQFVARSLLALLKGTKKVWKKTKSFGGKIFAEFKKYVKKKKLSLLSEKLSIEKKGCVFEWRLVLSLLAGKIL